MKTHQHDLTILTRANVIPFFGDQNVKVVSGKRDQLETECEPKVMTGMMGRDSNRIRHQDPIDSLLLTICWSVCSIQMFLPFQALRNDKFSSFGWMPSLFSPSCRRSP